jgi:cytochrome P450
VTTAFDPGRYLLDAYRGEILGEALFALSAEREDEPGRVQKWRLLERLERHVKQRLRPVLEGRGLPTGEHASSVEEGRKLAVALSHTPWRARMEAIAAGVRGYVEEFRAAEAAAPADLRELARFVLGHEQALLEFFEREGAGDGDTSAKPVAAFLDATGAPEDVPIPEGVELTPFDPAFREDPYPTLAELRRRAPVHRDRHVGRVVLTGHGDVQRVLRDLDFWVDPRKSLPDDPVRMFLRDGGEPSMLFLDDPEHKRLRNLVSRAFTPRAVERARPLVRAVARELLDAIERAGEPEFDLMPALAGPLPAIAIARMLGLDAADQAQLKAWSEASNEEFFNPFPTEAQKRASERAQQGLEACFRVEIEKRRAQPSDDLIGQMVRAEEEGDTLTETEIVSMCSLLLIAGNVTTTDLIGNGVRALIEHPDQLEKLRRDPGLIRNAVEEMLRYDPPVITSGRIAPRDLEVGGVPVRKGESLTLFLAAANRDPAVNPDPDRFDIERRDIHYLSFGGGAHLCLGAHLARLEAQEAIGALVARFPRLRPADRGFTYKQVPGFRGLAENWLRAD